MVTGLGKAIELDINPLNKTITILKLIMSSVQASDVIGVLRNTKRHVDCIHDSIKKKIVDMSRQIYNKIGYRFFF